MSEGEGVSRSGGGGGGQEERWRRIAALQHARGEACVCNVVMLRSRRKCGFFFLRRVMGDVECWDSGGR
jgi:hypothetical protein